MSEKCQPDRKTAPHLRVVEGQDYLTVREVAALLKVSTATVYRLCELGEIEHFRVLNSIRVSRAAVHRYCEQQSP